MSFFHRCFQNVNSPFKNISLWWSNPFKLFNAVLGTLIRMFLGLHDPDPVRGTDPEAPDPSLF